MEIENNSQEILIVEDSPTQAEELKFLLQKNNYQVSVACNGREAIDLMNKHKPIIVISDIVMPEMDGYQLCSYIKSDETLKKIPVVLLTSLSDPGDVLKGLECGADNFMTKPYDEKILVSRLNFLIINKNLRETDRVQMGVEIFFGGRKYFISAERQQILDLLFSTYETAVWKNIELTRVQEELKALNERLEETVDERTAALIAEIEQRKRTEDVLKEREEQFRKVIESAINAVILADNDGIIISWNPSAEKIFLYDENEVIGKPLTILMPERYRDNHLRGRKHLTSTGESKIIGKIVEMHGLRKDGSEFPLEMSLTSWETEKGRFYGGIIHDITERKKAEETRFENVRLAAADNAKSEFLANMSHELRTPLNASIGFSELLKQGKYGELSEKQKHYVDNILASNQFLLTLINDILDLSKIEAGKIDLMPEMMSVPIAIQETLSLIKEKAMKHNVLLKTEFDPEIEFIEADKQRFKQILFNLLSNAVKFSKETGGTLTITAKKEADVVKISVSDTGIGIKEENVSKLFQKFEQLESGISKKYGGTGLGLAITKQLVELHGGTIMAESRYGEGSTFTFTLPITVKIGER